MSTKAQYLLLVAMTVLLAVTLCYVGFLMIQDNFGTLLR